MSGFAKHFFQSKNSQPARAPCPPGVKRWWLRHCDGTQRSRNCVCKTTASTPLGTRCWQPAVVRIWDEKGKLLLLLLWQCHWPTSLQKCGRHCGPSNIRKYRICLSQLRESWNPQWQGRWQIHWLPNTSEHVDHDGIVSLRGVFAHSRLDHIGNQWSGNPRRNHCRWRELELYCRFWLVVWHIDWKKTRFLYLLRLLQGTRVPLLPDGLLNHK